MTFIPAVMPLQEAAPATDFSFFIMMGLIFVIFYTLVIRPQNKKQRLHEEAVKKAEKNDHVVTAGGIHGKVVEVADETLTLEIAKGVKVKVARQRIDSIAKAGAAKADAKTEKNAKDTEDKKAAEK